MKEYKLLHLEETLSTNSDLKKLLSEGLLEDWFTVYADFQIAGRGQRGNTWEADPSKNLLFSTILFPKDLKANNQFIISQMISLAIRDVLEQYTTGITIKWPNDIYWQEKKIAGILIENNLTGNSIDNLIVGVGLNLNQESFKSDAPNPISLSQITGQIFDIEHLLKQILNRLFYYYESEKSENIRQSYMKALFRREGFHLYSDGNSDFLARIVEVKGSGILVLELQNGLLREFAFKEIKFLL